MSSPLFIIKKRDRFFIYSHLNIYLFLFFIVCYVIFSWFWNFTFVLLFLTSLSTLFFVKIILTNILFSKLEIYENKIKIYYNFLPNIEILRADDILISRDYFLTNRVLFRIKTKKWLDKKISIPAINNEDYQQILSTLNKQTLAHEQLATIKNEKNLGDKALFIRDTLYLIVGIGLVITGLMKIKLFGILFLTFGTWLCLVSLRLLIANVCFKQMQIYKNKTIIQYLKLGTFELENKEIFNFIIIRHSCYLEKGFLTFNSYPFLSSFEQILKNKVAFKKADIEMVVCAGYNCSKVEH